MEQTQLSEATAKSTEKTISQPQAPSAVLTNVSSSASTGSDSTSLQVTQKPAPDSGNLKPTSEKDESCDPTQTSTSEPTKLPSTSMTQVFSASEKLPGTFELLLFTQLSFNYYCAYNYCFNYYCFNYHYHYYYYHYY